MKTGDGRIWRFDHCVTCHRFTNIPSRLRECSHCHAARSSAGRVQAMARRRAQMYAYLNWKRLTEEQEDQAMGNGEIPSRPPTSGTDQHDGEGKEEELGSSPIIGRFAPPSPLRTQD